MGKKILCVGYINGSTPAVLLEKRHSGIVLQSSIAISDPDTLASLGRQADDIYICGALPTARYEWESFPKVKTKHLHILVHREATEKHESSESLEIKFQTIGDVHDEGTTKLLVAYMAVEESAVEKLQMDLGQYTSKIRGITSIPNALANAVCHAEKPVSDIIIVNTFEKLSAIVISSPDGVVKLARTVPVGITDNPGEDRQAAIQRYAEQIARELAMTLTFFKQKFRYDIPPNIYFFGSPLIAEAMNQFPPKELELNIHYSVSLPGVEADIQKKAGGNFFLLGCIALHQEFNLISSKQFFARRLEPIFNLSLLLVLALIGLSWVWAANLEKSAARIAALHQKKLQFIEINKQNIEKLRHRIDEYGPVTDRISYYNKYFLQQPSWPSVLYEISNRLPPEAVLINFTATQDDYQGWQNQLQGELKAANWQEGLEILRHLGVQLDASHRFSIRQVNYALGDLDTHTKKYSFQYDFALSPGK